MFSYVGGSQEQSLWQLLLHTTSQGILKTSGHQPRLPSKTLCQKSEGEEKKLNDGSHLPVGHS